MKEYLPYIVISIIAIIIGAYILRNHDVMGYKEGDRVNITTCDGKQYHGVIEHIYINMVVLKLKSKVYTEERFKIYRDQIITVKKAKKLWYEIE